MTIYGWDASDFDWGRGPMDLNSAKAAGVDFFTYKITEGTRTVHQHCGEALQRARDAGIEFLGAYHVIRTGAVAPQVDFMLQQLDKQVPWWRTWPGWFFQVDLEKWDYDAVAPEYGVACCEEIARRTGRWVVLYAPKWAYGDTIPGTDPLWASNYGTNPNVPLKQGYPGDSSSRWNPYSGRVPVFLQYGSQLIIGNQNWCDGNAYRGTIDQLRELITGKPTPPPTTETNEDAMFMTHVPPANGTVYAIYPDRITKNKMLAVPMTNWDRVQAWIDAGVRYVEDPKPLDPAFFNIVGADEYPDTDCGSAVLPDHHHDLPNATGGVSTDK